MDNREDYEDDVAIAQDFEKPHLYKVVLFNDDFTTMEFVIEILETIFKKTVEEASAIMLQVHKEGKGVAGIYSYDVAATKARAAIRKARENSFPLQISLEEC